MPLLQTSAGGEIAVLDTAGYGAVTITQAVSIVNEEGVEAGVTVTSGDGITITAGAGDVVNLRGLTLVGAGGNSGITFTSGGTLNIQNSVIRGFTQNGIHLMPGGSSSFNVSDTIVSNNGNNGIVLAPTTGGTTNSALFERVQSLGNATAFYVDGTKISTGTLRATATDSVARGNYYGFDGNGNLGVSPTFMLVNSQALDNYWDGVVSQAATLVLAQTTIFGNVQDGYVIPICCGGTINTFGNNYIYDTINQGALTPISQH